MQLPAKQGLSRNPVNLDLYRVLLRQLIVGGYKEEDNYSKYCFIEITSEFTMIRILKNYM